MDASHTHQTNRESLLVAIKQNAMATGIMPNIFDKDREINIAIIFSKKRFGSYSEKSSYKVEPNILDKKYDMLDLYVRGIRSIYFRSLYF
jgi:hypothetical protein